MQLHPLLTKNANKHYDTKGKPTIKQIEDTLTVCEMIGACKFNIAKYTAREKGQNEEDTKKASKYKNYLDFLSRCSPMDRVMIVSHWYKENKIKFSYKV